MNVEAFFTLSYGLYAVCSGSEHKKNGYIANTAFQVTAEPAQLAISCNKDNFTTQVIEETGYFSVSVLAQKTKSDLIGLFGYQSGSDIDKFTKVSFKLGETGIPILLEDSLAWFECKVVQKIDVGSHILFIGEIVENDLLVEDGTPLTYAFYRNVKKGKAPKNAPTYIEESQKPEDDSKQTVNKTHHCLACGWEYDSVKGEPGQDVAEGTSFEDLPEDFTCPICGATLDLFE